MAPKSLKRKPPAAEQEHVSVMAAKSLKRKPAAAEQEHSSKPVAPSETVSALANETTMSSNVDVFDVFAGEINSLGHFPSKSNPEEKPLYRRLVRARTSGSLSSDEWKKLRDLSCTENIYEKLFTQVQDIGHFRKKNSANANERSLFVARSWGDQE